MDTELYQILTQPSGNEHLPQVFGALGQLLAERDARQHASEQARVDKANAVMAQIEQQRMFDQMVGRKPDTSVGGRPLADPTADDYTRLYGAMVGGDAPQSSITTRSSGEGSGGDLPLLQNVFAKMERNGVSRRSGDQTRSPDLRTGDPGVIDIDGANFVGEPAPEPMARRSVTRERDVRVRGPMAEKYSGPMTPGGQAAATKMRETLASQWNTTDRAVMNTQAAQGRAALSAAVTLLRQQMSDSARLQIAAKRGAPKGADPFKWAKEGLDDARQNLTSQRSAAARVMSDVLATPEDRQAAQAAVHQAEMAYEAARQRYDESAPQKGGVATSNQGGTPRPTGRTKTDKSGVVWEEMSDGSARRKGA